MAKKALCIGINDYPGTASDLSGCVNDARDWAKELEKRGFAVAMLLDCEATKANMVEGIREHIGGSQPGDSIVITYSGHGTFVPDTSGDEPDGRTRGFAPMTSARAGSCWTTRSMGFLQSVARAFGWC